MSYPIRIVTRITLELDGPCQIGAGDEGLESDMPFVVDASGLPALPGSSLAGMLRARFKALHGSEETERWFGAARASRDAVASRVCLSWAHVHDKADRPVDGRLHPDDQPEFLQKVAVGEVRDHVRIDHRGVADDGGKYDRQVLYTGTRFTFDVEIIAPAEEKNEAEATRDRILGLLAGPTTRLGAGKHSGFGAFHVQRAQSRCFDLSDAGDFDDYGQLSSALDEDVALETLSLDGLDQGSADLAQIEITLEPETFFLVGGGDVIEGSDEESAKIAPVETNQISWYVGSGASFHNSSVPYLPASSIKGALSHRVAFHANRLLKCYANDGGGDSSDSISLEEYVGENNEVVQNLFGFARDEAVADEERSGVGRVIIDDVVIKNRGTKEMVHISTDPFTGGVRHGFLFTERAFQPGGPDIKFTIAVRQPDELGDTEKQALKWAIEDLTSGRLSIGSGAGRGNGRFQGDFEWPRELEINEEASA